MRYESEKSQPTALPICALRPIRPKIAPADRDPENPGSEPEFKYTHTLLDDDAMAIQHNKVADKQFRDHVVTWSWQDQPYPDNDAHAEEVGRGKNTFDGSFVRDLKVGDVVTVWGKARFSGWANHVERVKIDVYWAL